MPTHSLLTTVTRNFADIAAALSCPLLSVVETVTVAVPASMPVGKGYVPHCDGGYSRIIRGGTDNMHVVNISIGDVEFYPCLVARIKRLIGYCFN